MTWTKEYDRAIRRVTDCMAAYEHEKATTVESVVEGWAVELENRRSEFRREHLVAQELLAESHRHASLVKFGKVVTNLACLASGVETLQNQMSDTAHIQRALIGRRDVTAQALDNARVELVRIIQATARPARETAAYACDSLPPAAMAELQSLGRQDHAADLAELERAAA